MVPPLELREGPILAQLVLPLPLLSIAPGLMVSTNPSLKVEELWDIKSGLYSLSTLLSHTSAF